MYALTMFACIGCCIGGVAAVNHRMWWALPFALIGAVFFFLAPGESDED